eukprot:gene14325-19216_t
MNENKRTFDQLEESEGNNDQSLLPKPKLNVSKAHNNNRSFLTNKSEDRWRTHRMTDDYVNLVGDIMYPSIEYGTYGYDNEKGRFPVDRITSLGLLLCPLRKVNVIEKWSPFEIALFEASITLEGKDFHKIQKHVKSKSVKEIIEFYYEWKKTGHYKQWKKVYVPDDGETLPVDN